jgi:hypothetical protein
MKKNMYPTVHYGPYLAGPRPSWAGFQIGEQGLPGDHGVGASWRGGAQAQSWGGGGSTACGGYTS